MTSPVRKQKANMRILLVQLADIGDLVLTTPALSALREHLPQAHLTLLTSAHSAPILAGTPLVDEIVSFDRSAFNSSLALLNRPICGGCLAWAITI